MPFCWFCHAVAHFVSIGMSEEEIDRLEREEEEEEAEREKNIRRNLLEDLENRFEQVRLSLELTVSYLHYRFTFIYFLVFVKAATFFTISVSLSMISLSKIK